MPPKSTRAKNKRPLEEGDDNARQSRSKTAKTTETSGDQPPDDNGEGAQTQQPSRVRRIARGPKGEIFLPEVMPRECAKVIKDIPMPGGWVRGIDATPDRSMTLTSREWWEEFGPWLEEHKKKLKLSAADWKKRDEALKKDPELVPEDEGNDDWDFICCSKPNVESRRDEYEGEEEDEDDDEDDDEEDDEEEEDGGEGNDNGKGKDKGKGKKAPGKKPIDKLASLHPEWPWVFTVLGRDRVRWWIQEATKRDQDSFELHFYNDFTWYGALEVVEAIVSLSAHWLRPSAKAMNRFQLSTPHSSPRRAIATGGPRSRVSSWVFTAPFSNLKVRNLVTHSMFLGSPLHSVRRRSTHQQDHRTDRLHGRRSHGSPQEGGSLQTRLGDP